MRKLVVSEFISLDGVIEAPGGEPTHPQAGWTFAYGSDGMYATKTPEVMDAGSMLLGRITYEGFSAAWPGQEGDYADKLNSMPKAVVTSSDEPLTWNSTAVKGDIRAQVEALKADDSTPGHILVYGSATLVRDLLDWGLVDELRLLVFPVSIGGGKSIWSESRAKNPMKLVESQVFDTGVMFTRYEPNTEPENPQPTPDFSGDEPA